MKRFAYGLLLLFVPTTTNGAEMTFAEILKNVERRESRTGAILSVRATKDQRANGSPAKFNFFSIELTTHSAEVEMYNNYLTGKQGDTFEFPLSPEIESEYVRLRNLTELQKLDAAVADAERRRRIFVASSFKLREGSSLRQVHTLFGKPNAVRSWMKAGWETLDYPGLSITMAFGKVHDLHEKPKQ